MPSSLINLGKYEILSEIGRGGFGIVYRAVETKLNRRPIALKVLAPHLLFDPQAVERFQRVSIAAQFNHSSIIRFFDSGEEQGLLYAALEYAAGGNLRNLINRSGLLPMGQILKIMIDCITGLEFLHQSRVIHCNVKPSNILLDAEGNAKIADLCLAKVRGQETEDLRTLQSRFGAPAYMSPEQLRGSDPLTAASDVYSLGCVLFEMLTGQIYQSVPANISFDWLRPDSPAWFNDLVSDCLAQNIQERPPSFSIFKKRLHQEETQMLISKQECQFPFDSSRPLRVFLCHASNDKPKVRKLYERLCSQGIDAWLDEEKLVPGQDWKLEITKAVRESDAVVVCFSRSAVSKAGYIQKEIRFAFDVAQEQPPGAIFLIPIKFEECEIPEQLRHLQWTNLFEENGYASLMKALRCRATELGLIALANC